MAEGRGRLSPAVLGERPGGRSPGVPYSPLYADLYHSEAGAWAQAEEVFIVGSGLPGRWRGRSRFVILETGFGLGNNFLATWAAWRNDPERCDRLVFISIEKHPLTRDDLARVHDTVASAGEGPAEPARALAARLIQAWPPLTPGLHTLDFEEPALPGNAASAGVSLLLGLGDVKDVLPQLVAAVDAFYLDGFSPDRNPDMWDAHWLSRLGRWAAPDATAATWSVARPLRDALAQAGFEVTRAPGFGSKRDRITASYRPRFTPPALAGGLWPEPERARRSAVVIGAGLAGCAAAWALSREGWRVTVLDQHTGPAQEASGNPGGLFHGIVHGEDGIHARAHRAAALHTAALVGPWMGDGRLTGHCQGLLRLDAQLTDDQALTLIERLGLPPDYLQWCPQERARRISGLPVSSGGWLFTRGGWLDPAHYTRCLLQEAQ
ncbi:MAG: FAD-dependent oxidoreductase, partial [Rubrivivax sp.]